MNEYRVLVPIGGQLPQAEKIIQVTQKEGDQEQQVSVLVSSIRSVTWGTKGQTEHVAGVFVDFWGTPWPPVLMPEDLKKRKRKHVAVYDKETGLLKTCISSDDIMIEVAPGSCPSCAKMEQVKKDLAPEGATKQ